MNINKRKTLAVLLAMVMGLIWLAGCTNVPTTPDGAPPAASQVPSGDATPAQGGSEPSQDAYVLGENPLEFSFYGHYDWYTMPNWGEDMATKWILENKKVNVTPISSGGNARQKFSTMIVSQDLPDVIWMERGADVEQLREAGLLVAFDDYLDKYPNLKKWAGDSTLDMLRSPDGKLYQFPNWYTSQPNGNTGYVVNKKVYEQLGSPALETTEDLYQYLQLVKQTYPDMIPFEVGQSGEGIDVLCSAFAEDYPNLYVGQSMMAVPKDGKLTSLFTDPVFREAMMYSSKLFREKLISQDAFTQQREQVEQKLITGNAAVYAASSPTEFGSIGNAMLTAEDPDAGYIMIWPIRKDGLDKNRIYPGTYNQLGWNVSVITTAAEDPEAIFAFLDWFTGPEGQRIIMWGPEGIFWNGVDETEAPLFTDDFVNKPIERDEFMNSTVNFQWNGNTVYVDQSKSKFENTLPEEQRNWETRWQSEITWKTQYNVTEFVNLNPAGDTDEGIIQQSVSEIYEKARAQVIQNAASDEEVLAILDQAERDAQQAGYARLLEYKTQRWQENLAQMGR